MSGYNLELEQLHQKGSGFNICIHIAMCVRTSLRIHSDRRKSTHRDSVREVEVGNRVVVHVKQERADLAEERKHPV